MRREIIIYLFLGLLLSCQSNYFEKDLSNILNLETVEIEKVEVFDEWAGQHGEGYILEIYVLSQSTVQSFLSRTEKEIGEKKHGDKVWQKYGWKPSPIDTSFSEVQIICLNYMTNNDKLKNKISELGNVMKEKGVFYSFYYSPDKENPRSVQLFILDTKSRRLFAIDQQV